MAPLNEAPTGLRTRRWTFTFVGYYQGFRPVIPVRKADNSRVTHPSAALLPGPKARGHARLACIKRAASVRPERVSYSPVWNGSDFYAESLVASNQASGPEPPKSGMNQKRAQSHERAESISLFSKNCPARPSRRLSCKSNTERRHCQEVFSLFRTFFAGADPRPSGLPSPAHSLYYQCGRPP